MKQNSALNIDDSILKTREVYLYDHINEKSVLKLIKEIKTLDAINKKPIKLWINSPGGTTVDGLALINIIRSLQSKIITIINGEACSMASQISVAGDMRYMYENSWWMAHDMKGGINGDYTGKVIYRAKWLEQHYQYLIDSYRKFTKLTDKDLELAKNGELWLNAEQCLKKGIIDKILKTGE
jgi:ATP-dependent Clp protease protease subunit